jgi:hypothetical protein
VAFSAAQIDELATALRGWAAARAQEGVLARSLEDATQIEALRYAGGIDTVLRAALWAEVAREDAALDHLVALCFADEPDADSRPWFAALFEHAADIRDRLKARLVSIDDDDPRRAGFHSAYEAME